MPENLEIEGIDNLPETPKDGTLYNPEDIMLQHAINNLQTNPTNLIIKDILYKNTIEGMEEARTPSDVYDIDTSNVGEVIENPVDDVIGIDKEEPVTEPLNQPFSGLPQNTDWTSDKDPYPYNLETLNFSKGSDPKNNPYYVSMSADKPLYFFENGIHNLNAFHPNYLNTVSGKVIQLSSGEVRHYSKDGDSYWVRPSSGSQARVIFKTHQKNYNKKGAPYAPLGNPTYSSKGSLLQAVPLLAGTITGAVATPAVGGAVWSGLSMVWPEPSPDELPSHQLSLSGNNVLGLKEYEGGYYQEQKGTK